MTLDSNLIAVYPPFIFRLSSAYLLPILCEGAARARFFYILVFLPLAFEVMKSQNSPIIKISSPRLFRVFFAGLPRVCRGSSAGLSCPKKVRLLRFPSHPPSPKKSKKSCPTSLSSGSNIPKAVQPLTLRVDRAGCKHPPRGLSPLRRCVPPCVHVPQ